MTVHVVEPSGWGGVYQHAASLAAALDRHDVPVVFHTAAGAEEGRADRVTRRACFWPFPALRPRAARRAAVWAGWTAVGIPTCARRLRRGDVVHVEGWFRPALLLPLAAAARASGCRLTMSPHNTFSRRNRPGEERVMQRLAATADAVFVFSAYDYRRVEAWGAQVVEVPLVADPRQPTADDVAWWRSRWRADGRPVVLFAGQVRPDKRLDLLVAAVGAGTRPNDLVVAVVGEDHGGLAAAQHVAAATGVTLMVDEGYQPLDRFVAAIAAADVVACPYRRASQSAILAVANAVGRPSVATTVGGLAELATVAVPPDDPSALRAALHRAIGLTPPPPPTWADVIPRYLGAYGLTAVPAV